MSIYGVNADSSRNRSAAASKATARRMERNTCPECGRRGAITYRNLPADVARACRWAFEKKCTYVVMKEQG